MKQKTGVLLSFFGIVLIAVGIYLNISTNTSTPNVGYRIAEEPIGIMEKDKIVSKTNNIIFYDNYGIVINYELVRKGYNVSIKDKHLIIESKDKKYYAEVYKLYDKDPIITSEVIQEYENLKNKLKDKYILTTTIESELDTLINEDAQMVTFKKENNLTKDIRFMSNKQEIQTLEESFTIKLNLSNYTSTKTIEKEKSFENVVKTTLFNNIKMEDKYTNMYFMTIDSGLDTHPFPSTFAIYESTTAETESFSYIELASKEEMQY